MTTTTTARHARAAFPLGTRVQVDDPHNFLHGRTGEVFDTNPRGAVVWLDGRRDADTFFAFTALTVLPTR